NFFSATRRVTDWARLLVSSSNGCFMLFLGVRLVCFVGVRCIGMNASLQLPGVHHGEDRREEVERFGDVNPVAEAGGYASGIAARREGHNCAFPGSGIDPDHGPT